MRCAVLLCGLLSACAAPLAYQPMPVRQPAPLPATAFVRICDLLRRDIGKLSVEDVEGFRIQTRWADFQDDGQPGRRRVTVFRDGQGQLQVTVEVRYLEFRGDTGVWTPVTGSPVMEALLADRIAAELSG